MNTPAIFQIDGEKKMLDFCKDAGLKLRKNEGDDWYTFSLPKTRILGELHVEGIWNAIVARCPDLPSFHFIEFLVEKYTSEFSIGLKCWCRKDVIIPKSGIVWADYEGTAPSRPVIAWQLTDYYSVYLDTEDEALGVLVSCAKNTLVGLVAREDVIEIAPKISYSKSSGERLFFRGYSDD